jgi:uncharacterized repeat protein (TIGR01451 family)
MKDDEWTGPFDRPGAFKRTGIRDCLIPLALCLVFSGSCGRAAPGTNAVAEVGGTPWVGPAGVAETLPQIMAREKPLATRIGPTPRSPKPRLTLDPSPRPQHAGAPLTPGWPSALAATQGLAPSSISPNAAQNVGTSFLGAQLSDAHLFPPDSMGAVGPTQFLVCVNGRIRVFNKAGAVGSLDTTTDSFFNSVRNGSGTSDPRVRYDRLSGRWFVTMITVAVPNRVLIAVSSGPTISDASSFTFYQFQHDLVGATPNADTGGFADYDTLGIDNNALYVGVNIFNAALTSFLGTTGFVINKANLLQGSLTVTPFRQLATGSTAGPFAPQGVDNDDPNSTQGYFIGVDTLAYGLLVVRRVSNPGGTPSISGNINITVPVTTAPVGVPAKNSTRLLDALDDRLFAARIHRGTLWTAHNMEVDTTGTAIAGGGRDGSRWYQITNLTSTPTLVQAGTLFDPATSSPRNFWIPSCAMSGQGHMALGCSVAGTTEFAEIAVAGRFATDALGSLQPAVTAVTSTTKYNAGQQNGVYRWGDFSLVTVDPNDDMTFWTVQEYCNATNSWGVRVIQLQAPPPALPSSCLPPTVNQTATLDVVVTGSSSSGSGFFDPGVGFSNHLSAAVSGGGVTVNQVTYTDPTHLTLNLTVSPGAATGGRTVTVTNPDGQNSTSTSAILTVNPAADLSATTAALPDPVVAGYSLTYTLSIANNGLSSAHNVVLTDTLPAGVSLVSATASQGTTSGTGPVVCSIGTLAIGANATVTIVVTPAPGGAHPLTYPISNSATVTANEFDPNTANNTVVTTTSVRADSNSNGIPDDWELTYFGGITAAVASNDSDGDGYSNLQEFLAGTDPTNPASALGITATEQVGADVRVSFSTAAGKKYRVEYNDASPTGTSWTTVQDGVPGTGGVQQVTDSGGASQARRFYRVVLVP